ncbi:uncharacterized protein BP5553_04105 [Venustampulla echinocandica]|uniref:Uncharacterized protein n=1 Tax=Venustampulla echinocandica TaxID=2656787 RepID=A0A370TW63_9HELO|nr:uncharacterized protein BP5553_04105 [Venustampulla echinocandica]RDL39765.1 hypothetical protein BP5553_04105 [Venustampulla echinocandica]
MKSPYLLLPLFATFALTNADANGTVPETGSEPGPTLNATGSVYLHATNMSVDPNTGVPTLWRANLNITEFTVSPAIGVITNSAIGIDSLGGWVENSTWDSTVIFFLNVARNATVDGQKDSGDCYATLGEACVRQYTLDISAAIHAAKISTRPGSNTTSMPTIPPPPESCEYRLSSASIVIHLGSKFVDGAAYVNNRSPVHDASNTTSYQEATTQIWPIVLVQSGKSGINNATGISTSRMSCLRANATTEGSKAIGGVPGAAVHIKVYTWAVIGVTCLVGGLLL